MGQESKTIVVHNGRFQADEVFAVAFLLMYYPELGSDPIIIRTRDKDTIAKADIVCDVGQVYSPLTLRFDHHQWKKPIGAHSQWFTIPNGLYGTWHQKAKITPSSCGLVLDYLWHYHEGKQSGQLPTELANRFFKFLVLAIDANDNGIPAIAYERIEEDPSVKPLYNPCSISEVVGHLNTDKDMGEKQDKAFLTAVDFALIHLKHWDKGYWRDQENYVPFKALIDSQSGDQLYMPTFYQGWCGMLSRAKALKKYKRIIWPALDEHGKQEYRVQVIPKHPGTKKFTVPRLDGSKVDEKDLVFVHGGGWIGATRTKEAAFKL